MQSYLMYENWLNSRKINFSKLIEYSEVIPFVLNNKEVDYILLTAVNCLLLRMREAW